MTFTLAELAARVGGHVEGDGAVTVQRVMPLEAAGPGDITFFANRKYKAELEATRASAVVAADGEAMPPGPAVLRAANPYLAFAKISTLFHPPREAVPEVAPQAVVDETARVHPSAQVMPLAYVGPGAEVGARTILHPGVVLGEGSRVGEDCILYPNVVVRERCIVGDRCMLQPGAVIGADGFGFAFDMEGEDGSGPRHYKVPQAGIAVLEDDVEIGANACVDRATLGRTLVAKGAKIDNLVQIAHNVEVGPLSLLAAQTGIGGSTRLGMGVACAGQVGLVGHIEVGDGARLGAQAGVSNDVPAGETYTGYPAGPHAAWLRQMGALKRLPELVKQVRQLEREVQSLKEGR
ncbi:MAG TPA: UDP-3-O-(3-hydroxymyristoyl)glucosamine N-acyltransferase [Anaeromyxobacteraceae bacterium]|nr:UDP-3-O-(3-hydroxymyristoyl)glucosamine N-acyltransferase [Anaeromyxobacteraceae bacterium]